MLDDDRCECQCLSDDGPPMSALCPFQRSVEGFLAWMIGVSDANMADWDRGLVGPDHNKQLHNLHPRVSPSYSTSALQQMASTARPQRPKKGKGKPQRTKGLKLAGTKRSPNAPGRSAVFKNAQPSIAMTSSGVRIRHRELIASIAGSTTVGVTPFPLNPGMATTFPWLSPQAVQYDQYTFHKLHFEYISRTDAFKTGSVIMAPDYDAIDAPPTTEIAASTYQDSVEFSPMVDAVCALNKSSMFPMGPRKYVRSSIVPFSDLKTYDAGNMFVLAIEENNTDLIGKLYVNYDVELFTPQTPSLSPDPVMDASIYRFGPQGVVSGATTPVDTYVVTADPVGFGTPIAGVFSPIKGNYLILGEITFSGTTVSDAVYEISAGSPVAHFISGAATGDVASITMPVCQFITINPGDTLFAQVTVTGTGSLAAQGFLSVLSV